MGTQGTLLDTYAGAVRRGLVDVSAADLVVGVVRAPDIRMLSVVDENMPCLAPPASLRTELARQRGSFKLQGLCDEGAHNAAWEEIDFGRRYREMLATSAEAKQVIGGLRRRLDAGDEIVLVCDATNAKRRSHRTTLREELEGGRGHLTGTG